VVAWGNLANECMNYSKGSEIFVMGRLTQESWEDNQGQKRTVIKILANHVFSVPRLEPESKEE
jgi:single-strand DNA-binding protein